MSSTKRVCFGIPSVFSFSSKTCSTCDDFGACRGKAHDELKESSNLPGIQAALVAHARFEMGLSSLIEEPQESPPSVEAAPRNRARKRTLLKLSEAQQDALEGVSEKVAQMATRLLKRGLDVAVYRYLAGEGGADQLDSIRGLHEVVVGAARGLHPSEVRANMIARYGWQYRSAHAEQRRLAGALVALGLAKEVAGRLVSVHRPSEKI